MTTCVYRANLNRFRSELEAIPYRLAGCKSPFDAPESVTKRSEFRAWTNSLRAMRLALDDARLPDDTGIMIEYRLPATSRRIDFIVAGNDASASPGFVVIELKQWSEAKPDPECPSMVFANTGNSHCGETPHPCYQAQSYRDFLALMNTSVEIRRLRAFSCAFMHNYPSRGAADPLARPPYAELVHDSPLFGRFDSGALGDFIRARVGSGHGEDIVNDLFRAEIAPSKSLIENIRTLFEKNAKERFVLIDEQRAAYETILREVRKARETACRRVVIVNGGPGTGKSVVAMTVLVELLNRSKGRPAEERNIRFVSPTASFRACMIEMLCAAPLRKGGHIVSSKGDVGKLFCGSMGFFAENEDRKAKGQKAQHYSVLIVDEAHRLHSRQNMYRGRNQIEDIIEAAQTSVFFIDDNQALRPDDIGSVAAVRRAAGKFGAAVSEIVLSAQFRCAGADGFLNWIGDVFGLSQEKSANAEGWDFGAYDFDVVDTPEEIVQFVDRCNRASSRAADAVFTDSSVIAGARMLAGYAWDWTRTANDNAEVGDVRIDGLELPWNSRSAGSAWAVDPSTKGQVGCVHTTQGLEFEYVGVFIGKDLVYDEKAQRLRASYDDYRDKGGKANLKGATRREREEDLLKYVCRCYRVLLSRGTRGARVYCCDGALGRYLKRELANVRRRVSEESR